jgi:Arc/MetJ-type ribon-helix-helix transcriptional regulator
MPKISAKEKKGKHLKLDNYTQQKLDIIMSSDLFVSENEAIRAAIVELAERIQRGEFSQSRKYQLFLTIIELPVYRRSPAIFLQ